MSRQWQAGHIDEDLGVCVEVLAPLEKDHPPVPPVSSTVDGVWIPTRQLPSGEWVDVKLCGSGDSGDTWRVVKLTDKHRAARR